VGRGLDGGAAAEPLELHEEIGRFREREERLHGIERDAADGAGQGFVPDDLPVGQADDGMEHRAHARLRDEAGDLLAALRLRARALGQGC